MHKFITVSLFTWDENFILSDVLIFLFGQLWETNYGRSLPVSKSMDVAGGYAAQGNVPDRNSITDFVMSSENHSQCRIVD